MKSVLRRQLTTFFNQSLQFSATTYSSRFSELASKMEVDTDSVIEALLDIEKTDQLSSEDRGMRRDIL